MYSKLFLDYYTAQNVGGGTEIGYRRNEDARGALYGYGIQEKQTGEGRWTVLGSYFESLSSTWSVQGRLQAQGDPEVNNHYVRSNAFRVTSELINSAALVRQTSLTTTRLSYSRRDLRDSSATGFQNETEDLPRLDWNTAPLKFRRLPVLFTFNSFAANNFDRPRGFQQHSVGTGVQATQTIPLMRRVSLTPRASYLQVFEDKREAFTSFATTETLKDTFTGFYTLGGNLRFDTPVGDWDGGYIFTQRTKPDTLQEDAGAPDFGVERSLVTLQDTIRPTRQVLVRVGSGYDFRRFRTHKIGFRQRVQPFVADLVYYAPRGIQLAIRNDYQLGEGNRALTAQIDRGERTGSFASLAFSHSHAAPDDFYGALELGYKPPKAGWRVSGALRNRAVVRGGFDIKSVESFSKELTLAKDFHDFRTRLMVRFRPGNVQEVQFRIDLRTDRPIRKRLQRILWENEWFPWRRGDEEEDDR